METRHDVLAAIEAAGFELSAPGLARFHRAGVIDEPIVRSLGRGRGRVSLYPSGTIARAVRAASLAGVERRLSQRAWLMWWFDGGPMSRAAREFMEASAARLDEGFAVVRDLAAGNAVTVDGETFDLNQMYRFAEQGRLQAPLAKVRRRVGKDRVSSIVQFIIELGSGTFSAFPVDTLAGTSAPEEELVARGLGLARAREESLAGGRPWLQGGLEDDFKRVAAMIAELSFVEATADDDAMLNIARFEFRTLVRVVSEAAECLDPVFGRNAFSFRNLAGALSPRKYDDQVFAVLTWSRLRHDRNLREGMEMFNASAGKVAAMSKALATLALLREKIPAYQQLLEPRRIAAALSDPEAQAAYEAELAECREHHLAEVTEALASEAKAFSVH